jgi:acetyl-CoA acetyltransferase
MDGAACLLLASEKAVKEYSLTPFAKTVSMASAGVDPAIMGIGPGASYTKSIAKSRVEN